MEARCESLGIQYRARSALLNDEDGCRTNDNTRYCTTTNLDGGGRITCQLQRESASSRSGGWNKLLESNTKASFVLAPAVIGPA